MLGEDRAGVSLQTEIGKGKNYLNKLVGEYESRRGEEERLRARLREKVRVVL
jgi:regulator of replication initiation timing